MAVELTVGHLDRSSRPFNWVKAPLIPVISRVRIYTKTYICGEFWLGLNSPIKLITILRIPAAKHLTPPTGRLCNR